jgi:hypothetical protein
MATVLDRREHEQDGISFVLLKGLHATAIAVDALPSVAVSEIATRLVRRLRDEGAMIGDARPAWPSRVPSLLTLRQQMRSDSRAATLH